MRLVLRLPRVTALLPSASGQAIWISVGFHVLLIVAMFLSASLGSRLPERPRIYTVALIQEGPDEAAGAAEPAPVPREEPTAPAPKPAEPEPEPPAPTPAPPEPEEEPPSEPEETPPPERPSLPDPEQTPSSGSSGPGRENPPPDREATPSPAIGDGVETGLVAGPGAPGGVPTIDSEAFPFAYYRRVLTTRLRASWSRPIVPGGLVAPIRITVRFEILRGGAITGVETVTPSGYAPLDRSALRAVYDANPLPPLPEEYDGNRLAVNFYFELTPGS